MVKFHFENFLINEDIYSGVLYFYFKFMNAALVSIKVYAFSSLEANTVPICFSGKDNSSPRSGIFIFVFYSNSEQSFFLVHDFVFCFFEVKMVFQLFPCSASLFILCRMEILERISTRIQLSMMKGVLQNWVAGQWKYLSSLIFSGTIFFSFAVN